MISSFTITSIIFINYDLSTYFTLFALSIIIINFNISPTFREYPFRRIFILILIDLQILHTFDVWPDVWPLIPPSLQLLNLSPPSYSQYNWPRRNLEKKYAKSTSKTERTEMRRAQQTATELRAEFYRMKIISERKQKFVYISSDIPYDNNDHATIRAIRAIRVDDIDCVYSSTRCIHREAVGILSSTSNW